VLESIVKRSLTAIHKDSLLSVKFAVCISRSGRLSVSRCNANTTHISRRCQWLTHLKPGIFSAVSYPGHEVTEHTTFSHSPHVAIKRLKYAHLFALVITVKRSLTAFTSTLLPVEFAIFTSAGYRSQTIGQQMHFTVQRINTNRLLDNKTHSELANLLQSCMLDLN